MRRGRVLAAALMTLAARLSWGEENSIRLDGGPSWKGFSIRFSSKVEPDRNGASSELGGTVIDLPGGVVGQRFIDDPAHKRSFGYDVRLNPSADGFTAEIQIEPLHAAERAVQKGWTQFGLPAGLPKYPVIPNLSVGDTVALDLLVNPSTGQKIVDYITLVRQPVRERVHDFSLADVQLFLDQPRVFLNGKLLESTAESRGEAAGAVVWLYIEGRGRFVFSLFPNQKLGFRDSGMIAENTLTFRDGTTELRVECKSPVAPGKGPYNLYVVHEPRWRQRGAPPSQNIQFGSADRAESVVEKK